ncbi:MAG: hypothetical protein M0010_15225 [Actinomycetota bacterium]|jgi:hypothetical protein|nr:hypothetical protein [Actinomycetota bacterium]
MSVRQVTIPTRRGDTIVVSLVHLAGEEPTLMVALDDADDTPMPTAELTIREAAEMREVMRQFCEEAVTAIVGQRWTTRR